MKKIKIDFKEINNDKEFYEIVREKLDLPEYFGDNLDALWDSITGYIELPIKIRFLNFNNKKSDFFISIKEVFTDAEKELNGGLSFKILS
jgi:ribonuclease inhibitor